MTPTQFSFRLPPPKQEQPNATIREGYQRLGVQGSSEGYTPRRYVHVSKCLPWILLRCSVLTPWLEKQVMVHSCIWPQNPCTVLLSQIAPRLTYCQIHGSRHGGTSPEKVESTSTPSLQSPLSKLRPPQVFTRCPCCSSGTQPF